MDRDWDRAGKRRKGLGPGPGHDGTHDAHRHHLAGRPHPSFGSVPLLETYRAFQNDTEGFEVVGFLGFTHIRCPSRPPKACYCGRYSAHIDSLIIAVDGACPGNGTDKAVKSACGVYFGPGTSHEQRNLAYRIPDDPDYAHTSQRAELHAALFALYAAKEYVAHGGQWNCDDCVEPCSVKHVVIKSDSAYLVNSTIGPLEKWALNGWRTAKKTPVKNRDLWEAMIHRLADLETLGALVQFWLVPRKDNKEADELANIGLDKRLIY